MSCVVLEMCGITKKFNAITALNQVSFDLKKGEIHALVGENGAGKSTLMKILSGSYQSNTYDGEIKINDECVVFNNTHDAEKSGIEMIYQEISLNPDLSVAENIFLGNLPRKRINCFVDWKRINEQAIIALRSVGLNSRPETLVRTLSTSEQQLICIAKALWRNPKILVLDEPTSALTETEANCLLNRLKHLKETGLSCIYISHKLDEVFEIADRVTVLRDGHIISTYEKNQINAQRIVEDMVGRKIENMYPKEDIKFGDAALSIENFTVPARSNMKNIVQNISFTVRAGEILGIGGLVGSGRNELINAIFGAVEKKSGKIYKYGKEIQIQNPRDSVKNKIGLLTEDRKVSGFVGTMDIKENISLASLRKIISGLFIKKNEEIQHAGSFFKMLNIKASSVTSSVLSLSGGNQQKVVLAKWLMADVDVLFLDEPTRGVDVGAKYEIYNIMTDLVKKGVAIVMISSELPELLAMCDRCIVLFGGNVSGEFTRSEVKEDIFMRAATGIM